MDTNDIVKYVNGKTNYILKSVDYDEDIAFIQHINGTVYKVVDISRLEKSNISYDEFYSKLDIKRVNITDLDGEIWKQCTGIDNVCVSNLGRVKSCNPLMDESLINLYENRNGHKFILLSTYINFKVNKKYHNVAFLVATAFIPNPLAFKFVKHKDKNPQNNNVSNLFWSEIGEMQLPPSKQDKIDNWKLKQSPNKFSNYNQNVYDNYDDNTHIDKRSTHQKYIEDGLDGFEDAIWNID